MKLHGIRGPAARPLAVKRGIGFPAHGWREEIFVGKNAADDPSTVLARIEHEGVEIIFLRLAHAREPVGRERIDGEPRHELGRRARRGRVLPKPEPERSRYAKKRGGHGLLTHATRDLLQFRLCHRCAARLFLILTPPAPA